MAMRDELPIGAHRAAPRRETRGPGGGGQGRAWPGLSAPDAGAGARVM
jgi:hypothetical protein